MQWQLLKTNRPLLALVLTSLAIFPSIFIGPKAMGIVFLLYIIVIGWNIKAHMGSDIVSKASDAAWETGVQAGKEGKYGKAGVYIIAFPMMAVGVIMVGVIIFALLFIL